MKYFITFDVSSNYLIISSTDLLNTESLEMLNVGLMFKEGFTEDAISKFKNSLLAINAKLQSDDTIVNSSEMINEGLRKALRGGYSFDSEDYKKINLLYVQWVLNFKNQSCIKQDWYRNEFTNINSTGWLPKLYGRYGIVELRVLENWLTSRINLFEEDAILQNNLFNELKMFDNQNYNLSKHWLDSADINFNLRKLRTNAGFYSDADPSSFVLDDWCRKYYQSLKNSKFLFPAPGCYSNFLITQDKLFSDSHLVEYINFPNVQLFYQLLEGHEICLASPFFDEINKSFENGRMFSLYKTIKIQNFNLTAIPAFISTYPNKPHKSWSDTFDTLCEIISAQYEKKPFTLFFATAGCYGMPLSNWVWEKYQCTSIYYGNFINTLFGVRQNCSEEFLTEEKNIKNWSLPNATENIKYFDRIDDGRYVYKKEI